MKETVKLEYVTFKTVVNHVMSGFKVLHFITFIMTLILMFTNILDFENVITILIAYVFGILLSLIIHEYGHLYVMKKFTTIREVTLTTTWCSFSIEPDQNIKGLKSIIIACVGPLSCLVISGILFWISLRWYNTNLLLTLLIISYGGHILSFWPMSGDGLMIVKGIVELTK